MPGIREEVLIFVQAFLVGAILCTVYLCLRIFRRIVKHGLLAVSVEDFFFWTASGCYLFVKIYRTSDGNIRWYFVLGVILGAVFLAMLIRKVKKTVAKKGKKG